jgi:hypothetical protein
MKKIFTGLLFLFACSANASIIEFIPPNDLSGQVFTTNSNDAWSTGRGLVFQMTATETIDSIGLFHDLTNINLSYELSQVFSASGNVTSGQTILSNGSNLISTAGLEWIDFGVSNILLSSGNFYHLEFTFSGNGNQNFFYNNGNIAFSQGSFALIEGTNNGNTSNFVMPALRLNTVSSVPAPAAVWLFGSGLIGLIGVRKKSSKISALSA